MTIFLASVVLGMVSGLLSGMLGIGGGLVIVPVLLFLFANFSILPESMWMIMAIATSLATIVFTAIASIITHHYQHNLLWKIVLQLMPSIVVGAIIGTLITDSLPTDYLRTIFIIYLLYVGCQMAFQFKPYIELQQVSKCVNYSVGLVIGLISAVLGIGGGTLNVPFLLSCQIPMKNAVAISSACGLPLSIAASIGYIILGLQQQHLPAGSFGYIYLPAFFGIICASMITAPIGAKLVGKLPAQILKRYFSGLLFLMATMLIII